jgi:putative ABC transport system permease protein
MQNYFSVFTLLVLSPKASLPQCKAKLQTLVDKRFEAFSDMYRRQENLSQKIPVMQVEIMPIRDTHFDTRVIWPEVNNPIYAYILTGIGLLILLVACINYISLTLTSAASRIGEIGMRKVMGAGRRQLIFGLWIESQVLVWGAIILAIGLVYLFLPFFNSFTDKALLFTPWREPMLLGMLLLTALLVGLVAGGYPAIVLSGFKPTSVLKGTSTYRLKPSFSRILLVLQYSMCLFLISCCLIMYRQMRYISEKDLGFNKERVVIVENSSGWGEQTTRLVSRLKQWSASSSHVSSISAATAAITKGSISTEMEINKKKINIDIFSVDEHYFPTLGIELVEGENFSTEKKTTQKGLIVNETLANMLGRDSSGTIEPLMGSKIIGVAKDHHYTSLESKIAPLTFSYTTDMAYYILIKLRAGHIREGMQEIESTWKKLAPDQPFIYSFLDEDLQEQYQTYRNWVAMVSIATAFALLIACLGLYALSGLTAVNRTKEIGIRKVMGASVKEIFLLLNKGTIGITLLSFAIAMPFAAYLMHRWLEDFAYRINLSADVFILAAAIGMITALLSVSYHSLRAAQSNPVTSLRQE